VELIDQISTGEQPQPRWRRDVRRRMNLKVHQHRSPASLFTLYFCECEGMSCEFKVALTDAEFAKAAASSPSYISHPRCPDANGRRRRRLVRRRNG
jgi:hypothetical protein